MDIRKEVIKIIVKTLRVNKEQVVDSARFIDDLGADSLNILELFLAFERKFNIKIPDEEEGKLTTVGSVIRYFEERGIK